ncbi:hypothetical protein GEV33_007996 [Tenebrio molitor]|uniref:Uncharacterized protein n=1 Tax=Tenebrio molitor TaxID=7067 RepID=A0A8J6H9W3_TENMO|nr:hypothetical protein GEV33_007996 [Tenebrio molitor]
MHEEAVEMEITQDTQENINIGNEQNGNRLDQVEETPSVSARKILMPKRKRYNKSRPLRQNAMQYLSEKNYRELKLKLKELELQERKVLDSGVIFKSPTGETGAVWLWQLEPTGCPKYEYESDGSTGCPGEASLAHDTAGPLTGCVLYGRPVVATKCNRSYVLDKRLGGNPGSPAHTLAVAVFFCKDRGRAVHPKVHTGLLQVLPDHPT